MGTDKLIYGTARPRFRIGTTAIQTNGTNYVLNQPIATHDIKFPKQRILNESWMGKLFEHILGYRGIFTINWDLLDRPSVETLIDILNSSDDIYMRPHFNYYKEYKVLCAHGFEIDRFGKVNAPYKGALIFETEELETTIPIESYGSFNFDGSTKINNALAGGDITQDITLEFWLKTPAAFSANQILFVLTADTGPSWEGQIEADGKISFITNGGAPDTITSTNALSVNTWYHIIFRRKDTDTKHIVVDGVSWANGDDSKLFNDITAVQLGGTSSDFDGLIQIFRMYSENVLALLAEYHKNIAIETIPSAYMDDIEIWWDFSSGALTDLSGNDNTGVVTGTTAFYEESYPDKHYKILT